MSYSKNTKKQRLFKRCITIWVATFLIGYLLGTAITSAIKSGKTETPEIVVSATEQTLTSLGTFQFTAYCPCSKCCGKSDGITKTGTKATQGRTIAVDPKIIPLGSTVVIDGHEYIAEDVGGGIKENRIDLFFDNHDEALDFGVQYKEVFMKERIDEND